MSWLSNRSTSAIAKFSFCSEATRRSVLRRLEGTFLARKVCGCCRKSPWNPSKPSAIQRSNCSTVATPVAMSFMPRELNSLTTRVSSSGSRWEIRSLTELKPVNSVASPAGRE